MASQRASQFFKDYSSYHRTRGNKLTHYFGITFIVVTLLGLLGNLQIGQSGLTAGLIFWIATMVWYCFLDWRLGIPFAFVTLGLYFVGRLMPVQVLWSLFALGWVLQFVGHWVFEKKSPAFFKNLEHLLIGPLWIFARSIGYPIDR